MYIKLVALNARYVHSCLALFYVRQQLARRLPGQELELFQFTINDPYYACLARITGGRPAAVFFSVYIWNSRYVARLVRDLLQLLPETRIVLGGPQAPFLFGMARDPIPAGCTVVRGGIESVPEAFYDDLAALSLEKEYRAGQLASFCSPYRQADFGGGLQNRYIYYESSRGCPFACTYCLSAAWGRPRYQDLALVREELEMILAHQPKVLRFVDRTFNDNPARALAIWRFLVERPAGTLAHFEIAPDRFSVEMFDFLQDLEPGRFQFEIGIQSTNPKTLAAVNRQMDCAQALANIARLAALDNIHIHVDLILGLPFETRQTFAASFNEVFASQPHYIQMGLLKVLPEAPMAGAIAEFGMVVCAEPPYEILANRWLDHGQLADLYWFGECVEAFYNNRFFRSLWKYLQAENEDAFAFFQALLGVCRERGFFDLAPTQQLTGELLARLAARRDDHALLRELLVFDWLRCGHRFLPDYLEQEPLNQIKENLWKTMPQNLDGLYDYRNRDEFFKQGVFARFSVQSLAAAGFEGRDCHEPVTVCFLPARQPGVFGLQKVALLSGIK